MSVTDSRRRGTGPRHDDTHLSEPRPDRTEDHGLRLPIAGKYLLAALRFSLGWVFLWAFLDKTFGWGFATPSDGAWINGGSPTSGFLENAPAGPMADFYNSLAGQAWVDWVFQIGLLGIGLALILGVGLRIAAVTGSLLLLMMWSAALPPENNPFMDDHLIYAMVLILLPILAAGRYVGFGGMWGRLPIVKRYSFLK